MAPRTSPRKRNQQASSDSNDDDGVVKRARIERPPSPNTSSTTGIDPTPNRPDDNPRAASPTSTVSTLSRSPSPAPPSTSELPLTNIATASPSAATMKPPCSLSDPSAPSDNNALSQEDRPPPPLQTTLDDHVTNHGSRAEPADLPSWVPASIPSRVHKFVDFADPAGVHYAIARIPSHATWGKELSTGDVSRYLCIDDQPVEIWLPAVVVSKWFVDYQGAAQSPVKLSFRLLRDVDKAAAQRWLSMTKPVSANSEEIFWASRLMLEWPDDINADRPDTVLFTKIFDATTQYSAHEDLQPMNSRFINVGDIVLVEAHLIRYKPKGSKRTAGWKTWATAFELEAVSVVARCPPRKRERAPQPKRAPVAVNI